MEEEDEDLEEAHLAGGGSDGYYGTPTVPGHRTILAEVPMDMTCGLVNNTNTPGSRLGSQDSPAASPWRHAAAGGVATKKFAASE